MKLDKLLGELKEKTYNTPLEATTRNIIELFENKGSIETNTQKPLIYKEINQAIKDLLVYYTISILGGDRPTLREMEEILKA